MLRRTPCIGICSTTYGDLVCRGCKRFAHEIVGWNGFDEPQRRAVWQRLRALRAGAVQSVLEIRDEILLRREAGRLGLDGAREADAGNLAYDVLHRLDGGHLEADWMAELGLALREGTEAPTDPWPDALISFIDREFYQRSLAHYERSYRVPAR